MRSRRALLAIGFLIADACCGDTGSDPLRAHGSVFSDHRSDMPCAAQAASPLRPDALSGIVLTFSTGDGRVLGTAATGPLQWQEIDHGCRFFAAYAIELPAADTYVVDFSTAASPPAAGPYFSGAEELAAVGIERRDLVANEGAWSFEAMPSYVVP